MFKRIIVTLITMCLLISLTACGNIKSSRSKNSSDDDDSTNDFLDNNKENENNNIKHTGKKLEGTIAAASVFSEGLAFVKITGNKDTTYCITKEGYIVFVLDSSYNISNVELYFANLKFVNGLAPINNGLCDTTGKVTYPEDVGATRFYDIALEGKYILAEKITSTYNSAKKEFGIMDLSFNWVVEPTEALYNAFSFSESTYYHKDYLFCGDNKCYLNLKTGEIVYEPPFSTPSSEWSIYTDHTYRDENKNIVLDLSQHETIYKLGEFKNGKAGILFYNKESRTYYFTLIDEKGKFAFEPVSFEAATGLREICYDGKDTIFITTGSLGGDAAMCYNTNGELIGSMSTDTLKSMSYRFMFSDGVVRLIGGYNFSYETYYYNPDFTPLF